MIRPIFPLFLLLSVGTFAAGQSTDPVLPEVVVEPQTGGAESASEGGSEPSSAARLGNAESTRANSGQPFDQSRGQVNEQFGGAGPFGATNGLLRGIASPWETPRAAIVIDSESLRAKQASDMVQALQQEVGLLMQSTAAGQASPFVRGVTGQQVLLMVDGIRLNNSTYRFGPNQYFNTIDLGMVDQIEVLRGSGTVLWGSDAIGGVINVASRGPNLHRGICHGDYATGSFQQTYNTANRSPYSRLNFEGYIGATGIFTGASFLNVRDLDTAYSFGRQPGTNYQQYAGDVKVERLLDDDRLLTLAYQHVELEDVPRSDRFPGFPGDRNGSNTFTNARFFDPQQRDLAYVRYQVLEPVIAVFDVVTATASYHRQREVQTRGVPTTRFQETDVETVGLSLIGVSNNEFWGRLTTGIDWYHDDVDSAFGGLASGPIIPGDAFYERTGLFARWDVDVTGRLDGYAGIRYETIDLAATPVIGSVEQFIDPTYDGWTSELGLSYRVTDALSLVGSISEGFRAPNLDELTGNNPNVLQQGFDLPSLGLVPERSTSYEVGLKRNGDRLRYQTFVYWIEIDDNIVPIVAGPDQFARANHDSYLQGVELDGELQLSRLWSLFGNLTYNYGRDRVTQFPLSRVPPTQGVIGLRWRDTRRQAYATLFTWIVGQQDRLDPVRDLGDERIELGGTARFATLNFRCGRKWGRHALSVSCENLTDTPYHVHGSGLYGTGFTTRVGWQFGY